MPFELGLDIGCAEFGGLKYKGKQILILETERYQYQKVLSDIAGQDIENHDDVPETLIRKVRNWISKINSLKHIPSASQIWLQYNQFMESISSNLVQSGFSIQEIDEMPVGDFMKYVKDWLSVEGKNQLPHK